MEDEEADLKDTYHTHAHKKAKSASECAQLIIEVYPSVFFGKEDFTYWTFHPDEWDIISGVVHA